MGNCQSKSKKKTVILPLKKIQSSMRQSPTRDSGINMAFPRETRMRQKDDVDFDREPFLVGDTCYVQLKDHAIIVELEVIRGYNAFTVNLVHIQRMDRYEEHIIFKSDQLIMPLSLATKIPIREMIITFKHSDVIHIRIGKSQLRKDWSFHETRLNAWGREETDESWSFDISHQESWSTMI